MSEQEKKSPRRPRQEDGAQTRRPRSEGERAPAPRKKRRRKRLGAWGALLYVVLVIGVSALLAGLGWQFACDVLSLNKAEKEAVITLPDDVFTIEEKTDGEGEPFTEYRVDLGYVADQLKEQELIRYPWLFKLFVSFTKKSDDLRPGTYNLNSSMDYSAIARNLGAKSPSKAEVTITIREGYTCTQIFEALAEKNVATVAELEAAAANYDFKFSFLKDVVPLGGKSRLEGYLFPDTYQFYVRMDPVQALNKMLLRFDEVFTQDMRDEVAAGGQTIAEIVNIASMIEKETTGDDQTMISGVIHNRLYKPNNETVGLLNVDATIMYYTGRTITAADRDDANNPYNTYIHKGLPPTAICNPGQASIRSAMKPESTNNYYYVLGDDGDHHFFRTHNEQINFINSQERYR